MIRDKNKIYGELNDPDTLLCEEDLDQAQLLISVGNHYVKPYRPENNSIIIYDSNGKPGCLPYTIPNKCVGTDAYGNLVMRDLPTGGTNLRLGSEQSPAISIKCSNSDVTIIYAIDDGAIVGVVGKTADSTAIDKYTFEFETPLVLTSDTECVVNVNVMIDGLFLKNLKLINALNEEIVLNESNSICNKKITIPAGTYSRITVEEREASQAYTNKVLQFTSLINY